MKIFLPLVTWIVLLLSSAVHSQYSQQPQPFKTNLRANSRFRGEVFYLNLENGYFGCQVNESTEYLQLFNLSKLCDGTQDCFLGADELSKELKCTNDCDKDGTQCTHGACLNGVCHCNDGYGGCNCVDKDENECKQRPCDVFAHCTNTLGSFTCTCFPGYRGNGFHCEDIDECQDPAIAARCVENAECCNLPAHFLCKCKDGYEGDGEVLCTDVDECRNPENCGPNALCINTPGNYTCSCPEGYVGNNPFREGCQDVDECSYPNVCGPGAICTNLEGSYRCDCPPGYDGDGRSESGCVDQDECARTPCGRNADCLNTDGSFRCLCPDGYSGDPMHGCEAACVLDTECGASEVCQGGQCFNPCLQPQACGQNAECVIQNHLKQCHCPEGFTGDSAKECVRVPVACDGECGPGYTCRDSMCLPVCHNDLECASNEKCLKGNCMLTCRVDNDCFLGHVCLHNKCVYGCHVDDDCSASESCRNDKCVNPCLENPCGPNAACSVSNHRASCSCMESMVPNPTPQVGCVRSPPLECRENRDCGNGLACFESFCRPLCADDAGCLTNERCQQGVCKPLCRHDNECGHGELCLGLNCMPGCRSDQGCPQDLSCVGQQCVDPCADPTACGTNAHCQTIDHRKQCQCPEGLDGNANVACKVPRVVCGRNDDCQTNQLCYAGSCQGKCRNDQNCLADERCMRGTCRTVCNTDEACAQGQICENRMCQTGCRTDLSCATDEACVNKKCQNPCRTPGQCGQCADCLVVNHGVQCQCPAAFMGDGLTGCQLPPERCECDEDQAYCATKCSRTEDCACGQQCARGKCRNKCGPKRQCTVGQLCERGACIAGCKSNGDCAADQSCVNGKCSDPCANDKACGRNALCTVSEHRMLCYCPDGYEGEPSKECVQFECRVDTDCDSNKRCDQGKCRNPCLEYGACGTNAQCRVVGRKAQCSCPPDFFGNPTSECRPLEGGCSSKPCGENSKCTEVPGGYECACMDGCIGDAHQGCLCGGPLVNACHDQPCGLNAACHVLDNNQAECYCPEDFPNGDAYVQCYLTLPKQDCRTQGCEVGDCVRQGYEYVCQQEIGCASSEECPSLQACINALCVDPCTYNNPCSRNEDCRVLNHQPLCSAEHGRTPGCEHCPPGANCDPTTGACIKEPPGSPKTPEPCQSNNDCIESEACYMGLCQDPCEFAKICAASAKCTAKSHRPVCTCPQGHEGNPMVKCVTTQTSIECTENSDCGVTEACINQLCQHPCDVHDPCATNAVCVNSNHAADCSCADGFQGNGFVGCQPARPHVCQYNEDCPPTKLCDRLNRRCINPCQEDSCGENAECIPVNHGTDCRCLPGFLGNAYVQCLPSQGCRADSECDSNQACINGKCSSPCQCGSFALCDVVNHRGVCKCPPGYNGNPQVGCSPPQDPCDPNPCGLNALCELDNGNPICYCPKGLTGNPFKNCIPEGDECTPNPCGPNSGCRRVDGNPICFCLPEYEGQPPSIPCELPSNPCDPSPCGPNTQCSVLSNGFSKCTCLPNYVESPNTIRGCVEPINPCDPNPCGTGAICDSSRQPVCYCPDNKIGNPFRLCDKPAVTIELCQPGPCGRNADCYVAGNREECYCRSGYVGDAYQGCREPSRTVCDPNPCGPNANCVVAGDGQTACVCPDGLSGDPTSLIGCHGYECQVDVDCPNNKACMGYRCYDPCPGACGQGAHCRVEEHHPVCSCNSGLTGNPGVRCYALDHPKKNPCVPSPCGRNSECKLLNNRAVCSCIPGYLGDPQSGCQPECDINSDCGETLSCINHKCVDPCAGAICGINAICNVRQHTPVCLCLDGFVGDAFLQCVAIGILKNVSRDPCAPSPCGPQDVCSVFGDGVALCDPCFAPNAQQNPRCRPECVANSDCPFDRACLGQRCLDPCPGSCGRNAVCNVYEHNPVCACPTGLFGNPYEQCTTQSVIEPPPQPSCAKLHCGANAECKRQHNGLACVCRKGYFGEPHIGCRPECVLNSDCPADKACLNSKCVEACNGVCGINAVCRVVNHAPVCICAEGFSGDAFIACNPFYLPPPVRPNPCEPSPCGPNSRCKATPDGYAACSCLPNFKGAPPVCQPECVVSSECAPNQACLNQRCADPCPGICGGGARCEVLNHNPICSCEQNFEGDPFVACSPIQDPGREIAVPKNPCVPSPCGPNSICQIKQNRPVCSCVANYIGSPPYCRPECTLSSECPSDKACIQEKCQNPCANICGHNARCTVIAHSAHCSCDEDFEGDAFIGCSKKNTPKPEDHIDPCYPNPCAENAVCTPHNNAARCSCIEPYNGDPYNTGCRPECIYSSECPSSLACIKQHCRDPCTAACGANAECAVVNHLPSCSCTRGFEGNPFEGCKRVAITRPVGVCEPNPCGPNSLCRTVEGHPTCSCQVGYFGAPPQCRPECVVSSECAQNLACINQKCTDPCAETCGFNAKCQVNNHNPICSCPANYVGDPFEQCVPKPSEPPRNVDPCLPSPCGSNSICRNVNNRAECSCAPGMFGAPPNCRPECVINQDCPSNRACIRQRCEDPCIGICGFNAVCSTQHHQPKCSCIESFEGDPYTACRMREIVVPDPPTDPCYPSPCGANAICRVRNGAGSCTCIQNYFGDPYINCRPECVQNSDCPGSRACINMKCRDPCANACGFNAICRVAHHQPVCSCEPDFTGNPLRACVERPSNMYLPLPKDPCRPSPCGLFSTCHVVGDRPVCACLPNYMGAPPNCKPECMTSAECPSDRACINQRCKDPCPGTCGYNARCRCTNHSPICSCYDGYTGDPFHQCVPERKPPPIADPIVPPNPCVPSPCGPNSQCQVSSSGAVCSCVTNYIGRPPSCRPECSINSECPARMACVNARCADPCIGSCGNNALCHVSLHAPVCMCEPGFSGDPFSGCYKIIETPVEVIQPCRPSPCGLNALCEERNQAAACKCLPEFFGDPYVECRPECVINSDCPRSRACVNQKCVDPCPGMCGHSAQCAVFNHAPNCECLPGYTGNPIVGCHLVPEIPRYPDPIVPDNPCQPSPCGLYSNCRSVNGHAVCSCVPNYIGSPPNCRPECMSSSECAQDKSCLNERCKDPCPGTCGNNALCRVVNHNPICSCSPGFSGDPFVRCFPQEKRPPITHDRIDPCVPTPCGPNSQCRVSAATEQAVCSCLQHYVGRAPNCRPECTSDSECPGNSACINLRCQDPCVGTCGIQTTCLVNNHRPICRCIEGYAGDPFSECSPKIIVPVEVAQPCNPSPCGANAVCKERNGVGSCSCLPEYNGDPYTECRPECVLNSECSKNRACLNNKCRDPCPGVCGVSAECHVINHAPSCSCPSGFTGNPSQYCREIPRLPAPVEPCRPSPCGPYSQCREVNGHAVCSCVTNYIGTPPACRPECSVSSECAQDRACVNQRCVDPCPGTCGNEAICKVTNHNPICSCPAGFSGDPFVRCAPWQEEPEQPKSNENPCVPSPCGRNSQCRVVGETGVCSCLPNFVGRAPNCRPECTLNTECPATLACVNERCQDPCPGSCGFNAYCSVVNHSPVCSCDNGYTGDPFAGCNPQPPSIPDERLTPCQPSPCGPNAECRERNGAGSCTCLPEYFGDPYSGCRPECVVNSDCSRDKSCVNQKCVDPCPGVCGLNAQCRVSNHLPSCSCLAGYTGNPSSACREIPQLPPPPERDENPCRPSPCGAYSQCREVNGHAVCSCLQGFIGSAPNCRPECIISSDCAQDLNCQNQKCVDPCPGTCGIEARCQVINHYPACSCAPGFTGDPFNRCTKILLEPPPTEKSGNPCIPSPCGPNSKCLDVRGSPACSCLPDYLGRPPNCRPECLSSADCTANLACVNQRCSNPCIGACGLHSVCTVIKHRPTCECVPGYTGDPFSGCAIVQQIPAIDEPRNPCNPSPCGANAVCRERNGAGSCACLPEYFGDPYSGCRPECVQNDDCERSRACINNKCQDPCPGACGINAECRVLNHGPNCNCFEGYTGDPHHSCSLIEVVTRRPDNPCQPSPCGPYSQCLDTNSHAVCSCLEGYIGAPPSCKPECVVSSECPQNRACINQKCEDPCRGSCGNNAKCQVVNHNPICTCQAGMTGDPISGCEPTPTVKDVDDNPCVPSPCGPNSICRQIGNQAACSCKTSFIGRPPNCRPECTNNDECQNHLSCQQELCVDPCPGSCGSNAICQVVQHNAVCSCADGYEGEPLFGCQLIPAVTPTESPNSPCEPSPCGPHAECRERNGAGACYCHDGFEGNPYDAQRGCRRECENNDECSAVQACSRFKCVDPCNNICGDYAICTVDKHVPTCDCPPGYTGDPFFSCKPVPVTPRPPLNPCNPSPCGPNSNCRAMNNQAVCSCQAGFVNQPPNCKPECVVSAECAPERACVNKKCVDPCLHTCGIRAICTTKNHSPICTCPRTMTGDPFVECTKVAITHDVTTPSPAPASCVPSPCGPNAKCQIVGNSPACSCLPNFIGAPPRCRPECVLNSECGPTEACINQKCADPCSGSCGFEAKCHVLNHLPICNCIEGFEGDPFVRCTKKETVKTSTVNDPCNPNPCGQNADCFAGECRCQNNYQGNAYEGCRPECTLSADCPRDKACMRNRCVDPCPGICGNNAMCEVMNHIPVCSCFQGYEGDPFVNCRVKPVVEDPIIEACSPSPCGSNSQCRDVNGHAVCSCLEGYIGAPPQCRPECVVSSECSALQACVNKKCVDPCAAACGLEARCEVINHSPICGCPPGRTGDPFKQCVVLPPVPAPDVKNTPQDPCLPSPCGPNSYCKPDKNGPVCQCQPEFFGSPPNCRPECIINPDCQSTQACINNKCSNPCPESCGTNAECRVIGHAVSCSCPVGYAGNAFVQCVPQQDEPPKPCQPSPCGANAECIERNGAAACKCIDEYQGNPYEGCRPECVLSSDCPTDKACIRNKCQDPCPGICGLNAQCYAVNHVPNCVCNDGYTGDPFASCRRVEVTPPPAVAEPCTPSPCGANSKCRVANGLAVCSCLDTFIGAPPNCKPECTVNAECPSTKACHKFRCANPCAKTCGLNAKCEVINHNPICSCPLDMTGDPFARCYPAPPPPIPGPKDEPVKRPCQPSPCGLNSECRVRDEQASCSCLPNFIGAPPNCRPECVVNTDCSPDRACIAEKCRDPCDGSCGVDSECRVQNHLAICTCRGGFTGDPFVRCIEFIEETTKSPPLTQDPCDVQQCGSNAECRNGICSCLPEYQGDPYTSCRPECTLSTDCPPTKACLNKKCVDPCPGVCGQNSQCDVSNHIPICSCLQGYTGDPFVHCRHETPVPKDPCQPNPCGPNSLCHISGQGPVCACQPGMLGSPPACKPECIVSSECSLQTACVNRKCVDPCPGACGQFARCQVINHNPSCSCNTGYTGDPFTRCYQEERKPPQTPDNPCQPSPCGPNSECKVLNGNAACSCAATFIGTPPSCRPECSINPECPPTKACIRQKCSDPCANACGFNARCNVANHQPICTCDVGFTGDPFTGCQKEQDEPKPIPTPKNPCYPSPCGTNAVCRVQGENYVCECSQLEYIGNPYEGCRPECVGNSECPANQACIRSKCQDPCPGVCGLEAICTMNNHIPICSCPPGYTGNAFAQCTRQLTPPPPSEPCYPSPCGPNSLCRVQNEKAVCECLPGFFGNPQTQGCRPECTLSSDCAKDRACINSKCVDACVGECGFGAVCQTINHSPVCSCPANMVGNPFVQCEEPRQIEVVDPCQPSPCRSNGICRVYNGAATCSYPECVINEDCSRDRACVSQKCRDPCLNACGINAICRAINHKAVCSCPPEFYGSPYAQCLRQIQEEPPKPECISDGECTNDKACINQVCRNPCEQSNLCAQQARCHVQLHRPLCVCNEGYTGNALQNCYLLGCRSDGECAANEACVNQQCVDPCGFTQCGTGAICRADFNHRARCHCLDGYRGNPLVRCERPECSSDDECAFHLACRNERCEDPCNCGLGAQCRVENHRAQCRCPAGFSGNPAVRCDLVPTQLEGCTMDAECPSKLACFGGECKNPCDVTHPCGANAICEVVDTLPLRTMMCSCIRGYVGEADIGCHKEPPRDQGCTSHDQCQDTEACRGGNCVNPCLDSSPCARTAQCLAQQHRAICSCPERTQGDPFTNCYEPPEIKTGCTHDSECEPNTACINKRCQNPCAEANPCAGNAECRVQNSRPICYCPAGWGGDPQVQCYKPECKINADCPYDKTCLNENCVDPCTHGQVRCGSGAQCLAQNHQAVCICPTGTQGNPFISCITGHCQYNEDCADHEACDRLNRVCRPVCDQETCALNAICVGRRHQPQCECRPGYQGNPHVQCDIPVKTPKPQCTQDADCPSKLACINERCADPCATPHVCTPQQTCTVLDTLPKRAMACKCPGDTVTDISRNCVPINVPKVVTGCQHNSECANPEVCSNGNCLDACRLERCGVNAQCTARDHYAQCNCPKGYQGNARIECYTTEVDRPRIPNPGCSRNDDCPRDQICRNEICESPCASDACGIGAYCHVQQRKAICRCPPGYSGNPQERCLPPSDVITVGCKSSTDCPATEACINTQCASPCNCGPNAECTVKNHHPICYCKPGFSGNAQFGCSPIGCQSDDECSGDKQCLNRECINPCLASDPCALNAECFGRNHRANCRCPVGLEGDPFVRCLRLECHSDYDCASNLACVSNECVSPCGQRNPCAQNAICQALQHRAVCRCPDQLPLGNPYGYCEPRPVVPVCRDDGDCPSGLACIDDKCQNPCTVLSPCHPTAQCSALDSVPVRTMVCECAEYEVPDASGACRKLVPPRQPGCESDQDCPDQEACIHAQCRNPCNCGTNAVCQVTQHRAVCSCQDGFEGNPYASCRSIGCRVDGECDSGKACINGDCINPCLINDPCGPNAECYVQSNRAQCRCLSGYRGNPYERCRVIGCSSNNDCPTDKTCQNEQCVNPCVYHNPCAPRAECRAQNHLAVCRCPADFLGNPYVDCRPPPQPICQLDTDCPGRQACINEQCVDPCLVLEPCQRPALCEVTPTTPVRTMLCICPDGYVSQGKGGCKPSQGVKDVGGCISDSDCPADKSCLNSVCRNPCNCGLNAECRIKDHKPVCTCRQGFEGNAEFECTKIECSINSDCPGTHLCRNQLCIPACQGEQCGSNAQCLAIEHRAVCECIPGHGGNARIACTPLGCRSDDECPTDKACVNGKCNNPCTTTAICAQDELCKVYQHRPQCACPPGTVPGRNGCESERQVPICISDADCPSQRACLRGECVNPCNATQPCGVNAFCSVRDTLPVRTMICECLEGYTGNPAVQCDKRSLCVIEKGFVRDVDGQCVCPPGTALDIYEYCTPCREEQGFRIDESGHCVCALERGMVIDERGRCTCPIELGYRLTPRGECQPEEPPECTSNDQCADNRFCNLDTKTCEDPCLTKVCGVNAFCNAVNHRAQCQCITGYTGNPELHCNHTNFRTDFPRPDMVVSCLADGVQVEIHITEPGFNGVLYVKGHSKDEECRRVVNLAGETVPRTEIFRVHFGSCGMQAVKDVASFVLVIQKHPKLVTYKAQAYNIKCVYQTGEKNVTLGFNVSMLTTAGTIANTGPPPICQMRIITNEGEEINSAEIGDNLKLQVDVEPATIYGGFARSCIAKTMEDNVQNEYLVTDENGCATDTSIFGNWEYNPDTNSLLASFNAFKFPSSDNIRFQCNIRVCFGRCQPVNCGGYNAFGRRRRAIADNSTDTTAIATNSGVEGQLREEITISSNAILTFEKRSGQGLNDANIKPAAQRVEDICVSMVGLIIALVITALLALVAVAVAVSCWLMAYRRRPKTIAPLPHPPEFPNPLFANPDAVPEPTPDYIS